MIEDTLRQGMALHQAGRLAEAEPLYARVLQQVPANYPALHLMGLLRLQQGKVAQALTLMEQALAAQPGAPGTLANYAIALEAMGRPHDALAIVEKLVAADPRDAKAWNNRGALHHRLGRSEAALADIEQALARDARYIEAHNNRGLVLQALGRSAAAIESYSRAIALAPDYADAFNNRAVALGALNRQAEALADCDRAIALVSQHTGAWINRAASLWALGRIDEALASYDRALVQDPSNPEALASRGELKWARRKELAPAIADLEKALAYAPDLPFARGNLFQMRMYAGDWRQFSRDRMLLDEGVRTGRPVVEPFVYQGVSDSPADMLACARAYAERKFPPLAPLCAKGVRRSTGKIRLGYLSGEFRAQATAYLTAGLFEHHDRERFEVIAIDNSRDDGTPMRARLTKAFDKMIDITHLSDAEAAARIAAENIDILVNLNGYFGALRMGVFAHRPAPVQVNYLGFPGSLGAVYIDYIMADKVLIPDSEKAFYSEQVLHLPDSYQVNDNRRGLPQSPPARTALNLPETGFVFCHFNYGYKITPDLFAIWMRLLQQVEGSVLWLLETHPLFVENLKAGASRQGVDPARLVFAPQLALEDHLARLGAGDLFLDSLPSNAHTTASDALWTGLPLLTCRGSAFAGRVATSLLLALDLPELVTENLGDYEKRALELARDPGQLKTLRARLIENRLAAPLFDTARTTRAIEAAYMAML